MGERKCAHIRNTAEGEKFSWRLSAVPWLQRSDRDRNRSLREQAEVAGQKMMQAKNGIS